MMADNTGIQQQELGDEGLLHAVQATGEDEMSVAKKIHSFGNLPVGWHYGEGVPAKAKVLQTAVELNRKALQLGFSQTDAFPGIDGEVMVVIYHEAHDLEFIVEVNGEITFVHEIDGKETSYSEGLTVSQAKAEIEGFRKNLCT